LSEKRLFCCLSLPTGVKVIAYYDIFQLVSQVIVLSIALSDELKESDTLGLNRPKHFVWWFFSSGLFTILMGIKCYYGLRFVLRSGEGYSKRVYQTNVARTLQLQKEGKLAANGIDEEQ